MWPNPKFLRIWSHLLKKSFMENFIFCAVIRGSKTISPFDKAGHISNSWTEHNRGIAFKSVCMAFMLEMPPINFYQYLQI